MDEKLLEGLNPAQREAVRFKDGPLLVLAGPGSGKTRVVTHRIAYLLASGVRDRQICALTFTNKAADEMRSRLAELVPGNRVWLGTFHRFGAWILRLYIDYTPLEPNFTIYDTDEGRRLLESLLDKSELPNGVDSGKILSAISWAKNAMVLPEDYQVREGSLLGESVARFYPKYQAALRRANAVDFDDLLVHVAQLLKTNPEIRAQLDRRFAYMLVDEYQDTNLVQYAIARALSVDFPNLAVTGDPDQSIYGWRGANIKNILEFEKDFEQVKVIRLEENYRSTKQILAAASGLIKHNKYRKEKELFTQNPDGKKPTLLRCFNHQEEADSIARLIAEKVASGERSPRDFAIFFRMNALSRNLEHALRKRGVPFRLVRGLEFFNRKEIKDLLAYFQLAHNPSDTIAFLRVVNLPTRGIGRVTLDRLAEFADLRGITLMDAARLADKIPRIAAKTAQKIAGFVKIIDRLTDLAADDADLEVLLSVLLKETRYTNDLEKSDAEEDKQRLANVQELLSELREFDQTFTAEQGSAPPDTEEANGPADRLGRFLELSALVSDVDALDDTDRVSLMTLHAAKGLEFPVVFVIAVEDNILPHERSITDKMQLEEERRLLFVGMTRAKEELWLTRTEFREYRGTYCSSILSRFLFELPKEHIEIGDTRSIFTDEAAQVPPKNDVYLSDYLAETADEGEGDEYGETSGVNESADVSDGEIRVVYDERPKRSKPQTKRRKSSAQAVSDDESGVRLETDEYCDLSQESETEVVFDSEGNVVIGGAVANRKKSKNAVLPKISSAADLAGAKSSVESAKSVSNPSLKTGGDWRFTIRPGALLRHPDYGIGTLRALEGPASDRIATIEFFSGVGTVEVPLADPDLKPVGGQYKIS